VHQERDVQLSLVKQVAGRYLPVVNRSEQLADFFFITTWRSIPFYQNRSDILSTMLRAGISGGSVSIYYENIV